MNPATDRCDDAGSERRDEQYRAPGHGGSLRGVREFIGGELGIADANPGGTGAKGPETQGAGEGDSFLLYVVAVSSSVLDQYRPPGIHVTRKEALDRFLEQFLTERGIALATRQDRFA